MKKIIRSLSAFLLATLLIFQPMLGLASSAPAPNTTTAQPPLIIPPAPDLDVKGYVLMDAKSGKILAEKNMNKRLAPASLTKLMTLYIIAETLQQGQIKLTDKVRVSKEAWSTGGSRMFLKLGSHVPVKDLIEGIIVASGNDACVAMAQYIAGTQQNFANLMNQTAARLGMKDTHFVDPTGLPRPNHYTTPHDLALLTRAIITQFPQYYSWYKQKWITWNKIKQPNRNRLLWRDPDVDGLKTGHTEEAGYCLISSAKQDDTRLISVMMGAPTDSARANYSQALLNWGFRFYHTYKLFSANQEISQHRVWFGKNKYVPLGVAKTFYVTIPTGQYAQLKATTQIQTKLTAPIYANQQYGQLNVTLNGNKIASAPLKALIDDPQGSLMSRLGDHIILFFKG